MRKLLLIMVFLFSVASVKAEYISNCSVLDISGYYELTNDITVTDPNTTYCILITADNVVLNGKGYKINTTVTDWPTGNGTAVRIYAGTGYEQGNVVVGNLTIEGFSTAVYTDTDNVKLSRMRFFNNSLAVYAAGTNVLLEKSTLLVGTVGVYVLYGKDVEVYDNSIDSFVAGLYIQNSTSVSVNKNRIFWNGYGIIFDYTEALVYDNLFTYNYYSDLYYYGDTEKIKLNTTLLYKPNVLGGSFICGNFWTDFVDKCVDANADGVCENAYTPLSPLTDYCPIIYVNKLSACKEIRTSGTYVLDRDIEVPYELDEKGYLVYPTCFLVDGVEYFTLDCKGHTITGLGRVRPEAFTNIIAAYDSKNVTVMNCNFRDAATSLYGRNISSLMFFDNQVTANRQEVSYGLSVQCFECDNAVVTGNRIYGANKTDFMCMSFSSSKGQINDNYIQNCYTGLFLSYSPNAFLIFNNYFAKNTKDFYQENACWQWWNIERTKEVNIIGGNEKGGNYWDKFVCANMDGDSFCDDAYTIDACNIDNLPLTAVVTYYPLPPAIQPFITPYALFTALITGLGFGLDFTAKAGGKVFLLVLLIGIMGAIYTALFPAWVLLVLIVVAGLLIAYMVIRFIGGAA